MVLQHVLNKTRDARPDCARVSGQIPLKLKLWTTSQEQSLTLTARLIADLHRFPAAMWVSGAQNPPCWDSVVSVRKTSLVERRPPVVSLQISLGKQTRRSSLIYQEFVFISIRLRVFEVVFLRVSTKSGRLRRRCARSRPVSLVRDKMKGLSKTSLTPSFQNHQMNGVF